MTDLFFHLTYRLTKISHLTQCHIPSLQLRGLAPETDRAPGDLQAPPTQDAGPCSWGQRRYLH